MNSTNRPALQVPGTLKKSSGVQLLPAKIKVIVLGRGKCFEELASSVPSLSFASDLSWTAASGGVSLGSSGLPDAQIAMVA